MVAHHRGAFAAAGPVTAGHVLFAAEGAAVGLRTGQDVMEVGLIGAAVDLVALLRQRGFLVQIIGPVQGFHVLRDHDALGVLPWAAADAVARIDRRAHAVGARAQIGAPGMVARACLGGQGLADLVGAGQAAQVGALAAAGAGHEEGHRAARLCGGIAARRITAAGTAGGSGGKGKAEGKAGMAIAGKTHEVSPGVCGGGRADVNHVDEMNGKSGAPPSQHASGGKRNILRACSIRQHARARVDTPCGSL
jgi:hypothetical protein